MDIVFTYSVIAEFLETFKHLNITLVTQHQPQAAPPFAFQAGDNLFYSGTLEFISVGI